ncbi:MAG: hypothetical protein HY905_15750 [Deltaproteobacteria bacterium]|nr:hypothetical protein [Deltaproteobacteria bacterium]
MSRASIKDQEREIREKLRRQVFGPRDREDGDRAESQADTGPQVVEPLAVEPGKLASPPDAGEAADRAEYFDELGIALGLDDVTRFRTESGGELLIDRRGAEHFDPNKLKDLPAVVQQVVRGRIGMLFHACAGVAEAGHATETAMLSPIAVALLEPGDGAAEALLASTAVASYVLAGRVAARLSRHLSQPSLADTVSAYGRLHTRMTGGLAVTLAALAKIRALRKDWDRELQITCRRSNDGDHVEVQPGTSH